jgi:hypothetical protein
MTTHGLLETGGFIMEKISGILGPSPRVKSADVQASPPIRPGMPSFGRPIGDVALAHRKDLTTAEKANMLREQMLEDKKHLHEQQQIQNMANEFFMNKTERQGVDLHADLHTPKRGFVEDEVTVPVEELEPEDMKYMPKGSYLDKSA